MQILRWLAAGDHVEYQASIQSSTGSSIRLRFRYSDLERLLKATEASVEAEGMNLPRLPPKWTAMSILGGKFGQNFNDQRQLQLQEFLDELFALPQVHGLALSLAFDAFIRAAAATAAMAGDQAEEEAEEEAARQRAAEEVAQQMAAAEEAARQRAAEEAAQQKAAEEEAKREAAEKAARHRKKLEFEEFAKKLAAADEAKERKRQAAEQQRKEDKKQREAEAAADAARMLRILGYANPEEAKGAAAEFQKDSEILGCLDQVKVYHMMHKKNLRNRWVMELLRAASRP